MQLQQYKTFVQPHLGNIRLDAVTPQSVSRVLNAMAQAGKSPQLQRHVFVLLRKLFGDAIENYRYIQFNPAIRKLKPQLTYKEAKRLNLDQIRRLLTYVDGKRYGLAIWIQLFLGLRCGELQALTWENVDFILFQSVKNQFEIRTASIMEDARGKAQLNNESRAAPAQ